MRWCKALTECSGSGELRCLDPPINSFTAPLFEGWRVFEGGCFTAMHIWENESLLLHWQSHFMCSSLQLRRKCNVEIVKLNTIVVGCASEGLCDEVSESVCVCVSGSERPAVANTPPWSRSKGKRKKQRGRAVVCVRRNSDQGR